MSILDEVGQSLQGVGKGGILDKIISMKPAGMKGLGLLEKARDTLAHRQPMMSKTGGGGGLFGGKTTLPASSRAQSEYVPPISKRVFEL